VIDAAYAKHLHSLDLVDYRPDTAGGDCFVGYMPDTPDAAVMIKITGGQPQLSKEPDSLPTVQVLVRGPAHGLRAAQERADAIFSALACLDGVTLDEGGPDETRVIGTTPLQSAPIDIGVDSAQRPERSLNFVAHVHLPTANRT
jgi:hypothetical protein